MPHCWCAVIVGDSDYPARQEYPDCDKSCPHRKEVELQLNANLLTQNPKTLGDKK